MSAIASTSAVSPVVQQASSSDPRTLGGAASMLMLKKSLDQQSSSATQLLNTLPQPALAPSGHLGTQVNTYA